MLTKAPNQYFLIEYSGGGSGKSLTSEAIQSVLGLVSSNSEMRFQNEIRKINDKGYCATAKSSILCTPQTNSNQHDSGGMSQLLNAAFATMQELPAQTPIQNSQLKNLCAGTPVAVRAAYSAKVESLINTAFLILQTNTKVHFSDRLDQGTQRRVLYYEYMFRFESANKYNARKDKTLYKIMDVNLQDIFQKDVYLIDMFGVFMMWKFQQFMIEAQNYELPTVPQIIINQTKTFFQDYNEQYSNFVESKLKKDDQGVLTYRSLILSIESYFAPKRLSADKLKQNVDDIISIFTYENSMNIKIAHNKVFLQTPDINNFDKYTASSTYQIFYLGWESKENGGDVSRNDQEKYQDVCNHNKPKK